MSRRPSWWLDVLRVYWPLNKLAARATGIPILGKFLVFALRPLFSSRNFNVTYLPVNRTIGGTGSMVLPVRLIEELIGRSSHRVTINRCSCRDSAGCTAYPVEDNCLLMGDGAREIDPRIARHISRGEAVRHLHDRLALGLIPMIGRVRMDDFYYGVPNSGRLLTICFCCTCCCTVLKSARYFPREISDSLVRVRGLEIEVNPGTCKLCGNCVAHCFMGALSLDKGRVVRDEERCKGCGRCASECPEGAVRMELRDLDAAVDEVMGRLRERITVE